MTDPKHHFSLDRTAPQNDRDCIFIHAYFDRQFTYDGNDRNNHKKKQKTTTIKSNFEMFRILNYPQPKLEAGLALFVGF